MRIGVITPAAPGSNTGNRVTANRWAGILRGLGHQVSVARSYDGRELDLLVAIHAVRSADSVAAYRVKYPLRPLVVLLAGTDVYGPLYEDAGARAAIAAADRLVTLQDLAINELREEDRRKARTIVQSALPTPGPGPSPGARHFTATAVGHLRAVKDPFRTALASRSAPATSRLRIVQVGSALDAGMAQQAEREATVNPRYRWTGAVPRWRARRVMKRAHVTVVSSLSEGGANVISEAVADDVPILASHMPGNVGLLGEHYPGYFPVQGTASLAALLMKAEAEPAYRAQLVAAATHLRPLVRPEHESQEWVRLIAELMD